MSWADTMAAAVPAQDLAERDGKVHLVADANVHAGYLTLAQVARYLGRSPRTLRRWAEHKGLPHYYIGGPERGTLLFRKAELDRWMRRFKNALPERALDTTASEGVE